MRRRRNWLIAIGILAVATVAGLFIAGRIL